MKLSFQIENFIEEINTIEEIISDTSKLEKLDEDPALKREASLQPFFK